MKCVLGRFFNIISRLTQNEYTDNILMKVWITAGIWAQKSRARSDGTVWHGKSWEKDSVANYSSSSMLKMLP